MPGWTNIGVTVAAREALTRMQIEMISRHKKKFTISDTILELERTMKELDDVCTRAALEAPNETT